jgi:hypothetical protein
MMEREALKTLYNRSPNWCRKVDQMSDSQVIALYLRFKRKGIL